MMKSIKTLMISAVMCGAMVLPVFSEREASFRSDQCQPGDPNFKLTEECVVFNAAMVYDALDCDGDFNKEDIGQRQPSNNCTNFGYIRAALGISNEQIEAALKNEISSSGITQQQLTNALETLKNALNCKKTDSTSQACEAINATIQDVAKTNN